VSKPAVTRLVQRFVYPTLEAAGFEAVGRPRNFAAATIRDFLGRAHRPYIHCACVIRTRERIDLQLGVYVAHSEQARPWEPGLDPASPTVGFCPFQFKLSELAEPPVSEGGWGLEHDAVRALSDMTTAFTRFGVPYLRRFQSYPEPLSEVKPSDLAAYGGTLATLSRYYASRERLALLLAEACARTGHAERAREFVEHGLEFHRAEMERQAKLFADPDRLSVDSPESRALRLLAASLGERAP
jgi:hypothetical protein